MFRSFASEQIAISMTSILVAMATLKEYKQQPIMKGFITAGLPSRDKIFWNSFQKLCRRATGKYNFPQVDESKF